MHLNAHTFFCLQQMKAILGFSCWYKISVILSLLVVGSFHKARLKSQVHEAKIFYCEKIKDFVFMAEKKFLFFAYSFI